MSPSVWDPPPGSTATAPLPRVSAVSETDSLGAKPAMTVRSRSITTSVTGVAPFASPVQPVKVQPGGGVAVRVTVSPVW